MPKFLVQADGSLGKRNDVWCASLEHKLGIRASPTAVLVFGDGKGEVGAGEECGIKIQDYEDIKVGDVIEAIDVQEIERTIEDAKADSGSEAAES